MRRLFAILTVLLLPCFASAQKMDISHWSFGAYGRGSHLFDTKNIYDNLIVGKDYATAGVEARYNTHPKDSSWFAQALNFPTFGLAFSFENMASLGFKNSSSLSNIYNLYGTAKFDAYKCSFFSFGPFAELGASYASKRYDAQENPYNIYIGSRGFAVVGIGLEARFLIAKHWETGINALLYHHSNGMLGVPNYGFNEVGASVFLRYHVGEPYMKQTSKVLKPDFTRKLHWDIYASYAVHSCQGEWRAYNQSVSDPDEKVSKFKAWPRAVLGFDCCYRYHPIFATGIGIDLFYTSNISALKGCDQKLHPEEYPNLKYCPFYTGVAAMQEFRYGNFAAHIVVGVYTFKRLGIEEDLGWSYQRAGFRYYFPKLANTFIGFDMRAHQFDTSDCLEWTIGIRL